MTDPTLIAEIGDALDRVDPLVMLQAEVELALLGHWEHDVVYLTDRPYEPGALKALAAHIDGGAR